VGAGGESSALDAAVSGRRRARIHSTIFELL
jgi:hypothetical protein